jgi:hypothetical protein
MHRPVLRECVRLSHLPPVVVPVRRVLTLHERGVDPSARLRLRQHRLDRRHSPEHHAGHDLDHPALLPTLLDSGVVHPRWRHHLRLHLASRLARRRRLNLLAVGVQQRRLVRGILIAGHQIEHLASGPVLDLADQLLDALEVPGPWHHREHQPVLSIDRHVIPPIPSVVVGRVGGVTVGLLLEDERPLLVELDLAGLGGKKETSR